MAYYGHPLVDLLSSPEKAPDKCRWLRHAQGHLNLPPGTYVTLMPGSRTQEIRLLLPLMLECARQLHHNRSDLKFLLPTASPQLDKIIRSRLGNIPPYLTILPGLSRPALAASRLAILASGSATLEAAILDVPMIVVYKMNLFDYALGKLLIASGLLHIGRFALPNLILQEDVVPELLQNEATVKKITSIASSLLEDSPARKKMLSDLKRVRTALDGPQVLPKIAALVDYFSLHGDFELARKLVDEEFSMTHSKTQ